MNTEMLNALKDKAHTWAVEHGFYEEVKPDTFYLGLVMSEAGEAINADRKGKHADTKRFEVNPGKWSFDLNFRIYIKDSVEDEIADIIIRLLDFAGLKGYTPCVVAKAQRTIDSSNAFLKFEKSGMPGMLFWLMDYLSDGSDFDELQSVIYNLIYILFDLFEKMTGSSKDLWWFVEQKMRYNDLRPRLNGKKY